MKKAPAGGGLAVARAWLWAVPAAAGLFCPANASATSLDPAIAAAAPEIVVVGQGVERLATPGSSSVINEVDLERSRPLSLNEALRQAPGLYPRDEEGLGLRPNIGVRGLSPTRSSKVLLLEDGVPLAYAPYSDNASYSHPPFRRFVRIETLTGSSQIRFGPQTVGGVINYITPRAPEQFSGDVFVGFGTNDYLETDIKVGGPLFGDLRGIGHFNATQFAGVRENTDLDFSDLWGKIEGAIAPGHDISVRFGHATEDSQVTYSGLTAAEFAANSRANPFANDRFILERATAALTHRWKVTSDWSLITTGYGLWFDRDWWRQSSNSAQRPNDASDPACAGMANLNTTCGNEGRLREYNTYGLETRLSWSGALLGADAEIEAGLRRHSERQNRLQVNGDTPNARTPGTSLNGGVRENNLRYAKANAAHVSARLTWGPLTLSPGVRVEQIDYKRFNRLTGARGATDISETVPGIGFSYALGDQLYLYGGVHRGFSPPRAEDIISVAGGVVELDTEISTNWEVGLRSAATPGLFFDLGLFRLDFDNQIVPASIAGGIGATLTNAGSTRHQGAEAAMTLSLRDMGLMQRDDVYLRAAATYVAEAEFTGARRSGVPGFSAVSVSGNRLPYSPDWIASAAIGYAMSDVAEFQLELQYTAEQFTDDLNTTVESADGQRGKIDSATIFNFTLNAHPFDNGTGLFFAVKNITDERTIVDRSRGILPGAPRLVQAGLTHRF